MAGALVAVAVAAGAFALGSTTAPESTPAGAPTAEGPGGIDVKPLGGAAPLPALREEEEAAAAVTEVGSEEGGGAEVTEAPITETPAPVEEAPASPAPEPTPSPSPSEEVVPEGL